MYRRLINWLSITNIIHLLNNFRDYFVYSVKKIDLRVENKNLLDRETNFPTILSNCACDLKLKHIMASIVTRVWAIFYGLHLRSFKVPVANRCCNSLQPNKASRGIFVPTISNWAEELYFLKCKQIIINSYELYTHFSSNCRWIVSEPPLLCFWLTVVETWIYEQSTLF